jgi:hypothetical protein
MSGFLHTLLILVLTILASSGGPAEVTSPPDDDTSGFIYGRLTLKSGESHEGFLRWKDEEAFWDDLFHSRQTDLPWLDFVDTEELYQERKRRYFESHGMFDRIMWTLNNREGEVDLSRLFICQFGYLDGVDLDEDDNVTLQVRGEGAVAVHGYSNDVSSDLLVYPSSGEPVEVDWDDLAQIEFSAAPATAVPYAKRLYGTVETTEGTFSGFIQWDQSECTSIDALDGDERSLAMGEILSLTKNRQSNSDIVLKNGETLTLSGTNDVGRGNRGVMVENESWGRVTVAWKRFQAITFAEGHGSGRGRGDLPPNEALTGTVTGSGGETWTGRIVYDLDEAWTRDLFNGAIRDLEYDIPFALIESIEKRDDASCRVSLASGRILDLSDSQDTGDKHAGLLVFEGPGQDPTYIPWSRVGTIVLGH